VRDITKEAGANVAAVNYHFGSRDGLVIAVISRYLMPVNQERLARLERAERNGGEVREIIAAFVKPIVEQVGKSELSEKLYCQLLGRIFSEQSVALPGELEYQTRSVVERFTKALNKALKEFSPDEVLWRLHFIVGGLIHLLTHSGFLYRVAGSLTGTPSVDANIERFLDFAVAGLRDGLPSVEGGDEGEPKKKTPQALFNF
ncbi:MAG: TetR/AcrR family transcriptional regulator, partial [Verrucomicrobiaceae bacterium]